MNNLVYTVYCERAGYPVRYINRETCHTGWFVGPFTDPGAASQEFQAHMGGSVWCYYLSEAQFQMSAVALIQQHRQALFAWHRWQALSQSSSSPTSNERS